MLPTKRDLPAYPKPTLAAPAPKPATRALPPRQLPDDLLLILSLTYLRDNAVQFMIVAAKKQKTKFGASDVFTIAMLANPDERYTVFTSPNPDRDLIVDMFSEDQTPMGPMIVVSRETSTPGREVMWFESLAEEPTDDDIPF